MTHLKGSLRRVEIVFVRNVNMLATESAMNVIKHAASSQERDAVEQLARSAL